MALTATSLSAACTATDKVLSITSTSSGFPSVGTIGLRQVMQVDAERMLIDVVPVANSVVVLQRGWDGTQAVAHVILAPVVTSSNISDFVVNPLGWNVTRVPFNYIITAIGANGVIAVPSQDTILQIVKATALGTTTLAAPGLDNDGVTLIITSETAAAHVITATSLIADGASGAPHTTLTFAAFKGASITLQASNGLWNVIANNNVTVS
jgi:hypothetical protein